MFFVPYLRQLGHTVQLFEVGWGLKLIARDKDVHDNNDNGGAADDKIVLVISIATVITILILLMPL